MIDVRLLIDDFESTADALSRKGVPREMVTEARNSAVQRRHLLLQLEKTSIPQSHIESNFKIATLRFSV
mgnify:CR=1 FL=1